MLAFHQRSQYCANELSVTALLLYVDLFLLNYDAMKAFNLLRLLRVERKSFVNSPVEPIMDYTRSLVCRKVILIVLGRDINSEAIELINKADLTLVC